jgi:UDP-N-acetylglucosamine/UDP-N-acetylgalactosamine diphosphorylase
VTREESASLLAQLAATDVALVNEL